MKKRLFSLIVVGAMLFGVPAWSNGDMIQDQSQTQDKLKTQDMTQDQTKLMDQDKDRLMLRDRLHITDDAKIQQQDRLKIHNQDHMYFMDMQNHWANNEVGMAYSWGIVNGYPDRNFGPNGKVTGLEATLMTSSLMKCITGIDVTGATTDGIDWNMIPTWAQERMKDATALKIANQSYLYGVKEINRLQFAIMIAKGLGIDPVAVPAGTVVFADQAGIPAADLEYVYALKNLGIVSGDSGKFNPDQLMTRAEAAAMLVRALNVIK